MRISESSQNPGKLYFLYENESYDYFEFWYPRREEISLPICLVDGEILEKMEMSYTVEWI